MLKHASAFFRALACSTLYASQSEIYPSHKSGDLYKEYFAYVIRDMEAEVKRRNAERWQESRHHSQDHDRERLDRKTQRWKPLRCVHRNALQVYGLQGVNIVFLNQMILLQHILNDCAGHHFYALVQCNFLY